MTLGHARFEEGLWDIQLSNVCQHAEVTGEERWVSSEALHRYALQR